MINNIDYNNLIGIPFSAENKNGINCYELLRKAYKKHGIYIPRTNINVCADVGVSNTEIKNNVFKYWEKIQEPEYPCGVLIQSTNPDFANHIGFYIHKNKILHVTINTNSVIERLYPKYKNKRH